MTKPNIATWRFKPTGSETCFHIDACDGKVVGSAYGETPDEAKDVAQLMAAAPRMLDALTKARTFFQYEPNRGHDGWMSEVVRDIDAAIAEAKGGTP